ncbi:acyl-CoA dehydrogenase [Vibrio sp. 10N.286.49.B3]|uniref:acyl-CoA dehydrogenase FadE n=1 Tax=Vibrio sp. 10N.286.49.B3 TaxID=1880855 RepID=UPI000C8176F3|nr:acyl-CoA dehydrogenase FadE [Vibrio sp. 10N.286.49.B3]PMH41075.1 acyl-CoA dehydrogenase [Vibrio sp. 10N.286.49.B3]
MDILLSLLCMLITIGICSYHRVNLTLSLTALSSVMVLLTVMGNIGSFAWVIYLLAIALFCTTTIRKQMISQKVLTIFKKVLPEMSQTEKEALDAGTVWWESDLFQGKPDWKKLHTIEPPKLSQEEVEFLNGPVNEVCAMVSDYQITHELADLPQEVWQYLKDNKFFAMIIKKEYGGLEFSAYAQSLVLQKLTGVSSVLSSTVGVPNSLGPGELLQHYGTEKQKQHYLPRLAQGTEIPCFALTSPEAGSDAGSIPDFGVVCQGQWQGEQVLGMRLTWNKRYITLAPVATVLGLAFKLRDPDSLLGEKVELGITCALIPTNLPGVEIGNRHFPLNVPFQNGPTRANDLFVPLDFIIGGPTMAGQGWRMLVECLSVGRGITLPSSSTGGIKTAALATGAYARIRRQFKQPIGRMEGIEEPLARIAGNAYVMGAASDLTVTGIDLGQKPAVISAIVKYHCTHRGQRSMIDAMDIVGGKGVCLGPSNFLARSYQGAPIAITVEGANILTRSMIIYGQGAIRCHPYVLAEMNAAHSKEENALDLFDHALIGHISFGMSNFFRSVWLSYTDGYGSSTPYKDETARYYQQLNRYSTSLALLSDISMATLGGSLKRKERLSARLGDILSQLYLSSATLKRFDDEGRQSEDLPLVHWGLKDSLKQTELAIDEFLANFSNPVIARLLRLVLMPYGKVRKGPSDKLDSQLAKILQTPSATRSRIGQGQYLEPTENNPAGRIEQALTIILDAEPIFNKVCQELQQRRPFLRLDLIADIGLEKEIITLEQAQLLRDAEEHRLYVINVDDFEPEQLSASQQPQKINVDEVA